MEMDLEISSEAKAFIKLQSEVYDNLVGSFGISEANKISSQDRFEQLGELDFDMTPFTYGEITFEPVAEILVYLKE